MKISRVAALLLAGILVVAPLHQAHAAPTVKECLHWRDDIDYTSDTEAVKKKAMQGDVKAQNALGERYWDGFHAPFDLMQSYFWAEVAVRSCHKKLPDEDAAKIAMHLSPEQRQAVEDAAAKWKPGKDAPADYGVTPPSNEPRVYAYEPPAPAPAPAPPAPPPAPPPAIIVKKIETDPLVPGCDWVAEVAYGTDRIINLALETRAGTCSFPGSECGKKGDIVTAPRIASDAPLNPGAAVHVWVARKPNARGVLMLNASLEIPMCSSPTTGSATTIH